MLTMFPHPFLCSIPPLGHSAPREHVALSGDTELSNAGVALPAPNGHQTGMLPCTMPVRQGGPALNSIDLSKAAPCHLCSLRARHGRILSPLPNSMNCSRVGRRPWGRHHRSDRIVHAVGAGTVPVLHSSRQCSWGCSHDTGHVQASDKGGQAWSKPSSLAGTLCTRWPADGPRGQGPHRSAWPSPGFGVWYKAPSPARFREKLSPGCGGVHMCIGG